MDRRAEIREFLVSRRARITPERAGIRVSAGLRRVPGLRRDEVALLVGVSTDYYTRLERGSTTGVSDAVLEAVARALQLDDAERAHLLHLVRSSSRRPETGRARRHDGVRPGIRQLLDAMTGVAAVVQDGRLDILAANALGRGLYAHKLDGVGPDGRDAHGRLPNHARFMFLDPRAPEFYQDWPSAAATPVALLRAEAGRSPHDRALEELVGELSTRSERFEALWAAHDVRTHAHGTKRFHHHVVGDLALHYETLALPGEPGLSLLAYTAAPGTASAEAFGFLASWVAAPQPARSSGTSHPVHTEPQREDGARSS